MKILSDLIPVLASNRAIQRVYLEYKQKVDEWRESRRDCMDVDM